MKLKKLIKDLDRRTLYLHHGKAWVVKSVCKEPSVTMICIGTHEKVSFGINSLLSKEFKRIKEKK